MCQMLTPLIEFSESKLVCQCEHGTIFIHWNNVTFQHHPEDFLKLAEFLEVLPSQPHTDTDAGQQIRSSNGYFFVRETSGCRIWIGEGGLRLTHPDFAQWCDLIGRAKEKVILYLIATGQRQWLGVEQQRSSRLLEELRRIN